MEYQAFFKRHPWGEERMDIRFSMLMAFMANLQRDSSKRPQPYTWEDFRIEFGDKGPELEDDGTEMETLIQRIVDWNRILGGVDKRAVTN